MKKMTKTDNDVLISKKALLDKYKISYGALYRYKRKGLIPDDWFIKKSTVTGQETFFPEALICERMELILGMKDDILLDELAKKLSGEEMKQEFLIVDTAIGEKSFKMFEVNAIYTMTKDGVKKDVTEEVKKLFEREEKEAL